jgi:ketosteroid isomerase-like protein
MPDSLPTIISEYFAAADRDDVDAIVACFADDATVSDEEREWHGHAEIREWRTKVATAFDYTVEVRRAIERRAIDGTQGHDVYTPISRATSPAAPWI